MAPREEKGKKSVGWKEALGWASRRPVEVGRFVQVDRELSVRKEWHAVKVEADGGLLRELHIIKNGWSLVYGIVAGAGCWGREWTDHERSAVPCRELGFCLNAVESYCRICHGAMGFDSWLINPPNNGRFIRHCASFGLFSPSNESDVKTQKVRGHLAGSVSRAWDSWSQGCTFDPHVGSRDKTNKLWHSKIFFKIGN